MNTGEGQFLIEAGVAHGITNGAEFTVYKEVGSSSTSSVLGILTANIVEPFRTIAQKHADTPSIDFEGTAYAVMSRVGMKEGLRLHIDLDERFMPVFRTLALQLQHSSTGPWRIRLVEKDQNPYYQIGLDDSGFSILNMDPTVTRYELGRVPYAVNNNIDDIYPVIRAAAHFKWHIDLTNTESTSLQTGVEICFVELRVKEGTVGDMVMMPIGMVEVSTCDFRPDFLRRMAVQPSPGPYVKVWKASPNPITVEKGTELGMFHFGGSTHCLVFGPNSILGSAMPQDNDPDYFVPLNATLGIRGTSQCSP